MKRFYFLCGLLTAFFFAYSSPIDFKQSNPISGSTITSFDFELEFDIEKALDLAATDAPGVNVGIGYMGSASATSTSGNATLYKGDEITGEILGLSLTSVFNGKTEGFTVNGNKVKLEFDKNIPIIANQEYTIVINNIYYLYKENAATRVTSTKSDFHDNPIVLKFTGADVGDTKIFIENCNIDNGSTVDKIRNLEFSISSSFAISSDAKVIVKENDNIIATTSILKISDINSKSLIADFGDEVVFLKGHNYSIILAEGSVKNDSNELVSNLEFVISIIGSSVKKIQLFSSKVDVDSFGIPTTVQFIYDLPDGTTLKRNNANFISACDGVLSADWLDITADFSNNCSFIENGKGLKWDISGFRFEPNSEYVFTKNGSTLKVIGADGNSLLQEYVGEDATITFMTPSVEAAGFAPMVFDNAFLAKSDYAPEADYVADMERAYISSLKLTLKDHNYYVGNKKGNLNIHPDFSGVAACKLYEITAQGDKWLKDYSFSALVEEDERNVWKSYRVNLNTPLYEGKKYKLVIPQGYFTAFPDLYAGVDNDYSKVNYIKSDEMIFTFNGTTPTETVLLSCSIEENSKVSALYKIVWAFSGLYHLSDEINTINQSVEYGLYPGMQPSVSEKTPILSYSSGNTYVMLDYISNITGKPTLTGKYNTYTLTIPKGMLINDFNNDLVNDDVVLKFRGGEDTAVTAETVNVNLTVNGFHSSSHKAVKGEAYTFSIAPDDCWDVEFVKHGNNSLTESNGVFTTAPLTEDADIVASLKLDESKLIPNFLSGVYTIPEDNIKIYGENNNIVIEGVPAGETINIYNVNGILLRSFTAQPESDLIRVSADSGQIYIVTVKGQAAKLQM